MAKRLVICCDGTWNKPTQPAPTNIYKLSEAVADEDATGMVQRAHYERGVGTNPFEQLRGGAFGFGLSRNVRACYAFLVENYEPGDQLFFFGFSRGAFTARSTVGLVRNSGILRRGHRSRIDEAYRLYRKRGDAAKPKGEDAERFRQQYSHPDTDIDFIGVFDTVGAVGIPVGGLRLPGLTRLWGFHDTELSSRVRHAYHALAIDERRRPFKPTFWRQQEHATRQTLEQVWFAGVHSDVGGGYRDCSLAELALLWMRDRARQQGLAFKDDRFQRADGVIDEAKRRDGFQVAPDPVGTLHNSFTLLYWPLGQLHRRLGDADEGALHASARERHQRLGDYRPDNLLEYLR